MDSGPIRYRHVSCVYDATEDDATWEPCDEQEELCMLTAEEPRDIATAIVDTAWKKAMDEEMASIIDNDTWELATLPACHKAIGLKWVYKVKRDPAGNVVRHKARLVAKGYAQRQGVDFDKVFAPVTRMEIVCVVVSSTDLP
jgi:hypothetical protein